MPDPERDDDDLEFGSGASSDDVDGTPDRVEPPPAGDSPVVIEDVTDADGQADPLSVSPDDPLEAVSDFLDDFVDSEDPEVSAHEDAADDPADLEG